MAIKQMYMILLSAKHLCCHLNSPQSETLPEQQFFFIVAADKVSWKQNHTSELINADLKVPVRGWFAGQEFKCSALPAAVCSLPKHQVHLLCHGAGAATRTG